MMRSAGYAGGGSPKKASKKMAARPAMIAPPGGAPPAPRAPAPMPSVPEPKPEPKLDMMMRRPPAATMALDAPQERRLGSVAPSAPRESQAPPPPAVSAPPPAMRAAPMPASMAAPIPPMAPRPAMSAPQQPSKSAQERIDAALRFLARSQSASGAFGDAATTALVVAAFAAAGETSKKGTYRRQLSRAEAFLQQNAATATRASATKEQLMAAQRFGGDQDGAVVGLGDTIVMTACLVKLLA
jgi:hypothetical protein